MNGYLKKISHPQQFFSQKNQEASHLERKFIKKLNYLRKWGNKIERNKISLFNALCLHIFFIFFFIDLANYAFGFKLINNNIRLTGGLVEFRQEGKEGKF